MAPSTSTSEAEPPPLPKPNYGKAKPGKGETWKTSKSKALLREGLLTKTITAKMQPRQVFDLNPHEHSKWNYSNWCSNLRSLRASVDRDRQRMTNDVVSYGKDLALVQQRRAPNGQTPWHRSEAYRRLQVDIDSKKHENMKPRQLYMTQDVYQEYTLTQF